MAPPILKLGTEERGGQIRTLTALSAGKNVMPTEWQAEWAPETV
jgi:hypothetical protein